MLKKAIFILFLLMACLSQAYGDEASTLNLQDRFNKVMAGDYIAMAQNKTYTLLLIAQRDQQTVSITEISAPIRKLGTVFKSWKTWISQGAPNHTSWKSYRIDLQSGVLIDGSGSSKAQSFLTTLLHLKFTLIPDSARRRIGPRQLLSSVDRRPFWQPPLFFEGKLVPRVAFNAWEADWPKDGSELAGKKIEIYMPIQDGPYPSYFPYWLQISGTISQAKIRVVDTGKGMSLPYTPKENQPENLKGSL